MEILSNREKEIASLIAMGLRNKQIANHLCIAEKTVKNHVSNIFKAMEVTSRTQVVAKWLENAG